MYAHRAFCMALLLSAGGAVADTRDAYMLHCGGCHMADGRGHPPQVPDLRGELGHLVQSAGGREYIVRVPGAAQAPVSDQALADILNWILTEFSADTLGPSFQPLSEQEVATARHRTLVDPLKFRARLRHGERAP